MSIVTDQVVYAGILQGTPPRLLFQMTLGQTRGKERMFTEAVPIPDAQMLRRIEAELQLQDRTELTVDYDYTQPGLPSEVIGYRKVIALSLPQPELSVA